MKFKRCFNLIDPIESRNGEFKDIWFTWNNNQDGRNLFFSHCHFLAHHDPTHTHVPHIYTTIPFILKISKDDPFIVVVRAHSDPHVHSLHDQSLQVGIIVDTYVQKL